jgi:hypothetical protein
MFGLAQAGSGLNLSKHFLNALSDTLADPMSGVVRGPPIGGRAASFAVLCQVSVRYDVGRDTVPEARASLGRYLNFYNRLCPHSSLDRRTPDETYFGASPMGVAA